MYHHISARPIQGFSDKWTVTPGALAAQMRLLALAGYTPIDLDTLLSRRAYGARLPPRAVVITFDDGYQDSVNHAVPILTKLRFTATFYLVAGLMGQTSRWLEVTPARDLPLIDSRVAADLADAGFVCGAHGLTHRKLSELPAHECRMELVRSREILQQYLSRPVMHLAYPHGAYNAEVLGLAAEAGYRSACSVEIGLSTADDDVLALRRVPVLGRDTLLDFLCRLYTAWPIGTVLQRRRNRAVARLGQLMKRSSRDPIA
jgi:peptidoglycan/xylan/chitin deacetylase (PgdA/CDA1 family)